MKKLLGTLLIVISSSLFTLCEAQSWLWAKNDNSSPAGADAYPTAIDKSGNVYLGGWFNYYLYIDSIYYTNANNGIFLTKYSSSGRILWASNPKGQGIPYSVCTDTRGNVYMTGNFTSPSLKFGNDSVINTCPYNYDFFIVKYDSAGNVLWVKSAKGSGLYQEEAFGIIADKSGNVYVTGVFDTAKITFGSITLTRISSQEDLFIVKYDNAGNVLWAKNAGRTGGSFGCSVSLDNTGNLYVAGQFGGNPITFGSLSVPSSSSIFLVKYTPAGTPLWIESPSGPGNGRAWFCTTDIYNDIYITGYYSDTSLTFGSHKIINTYPSTEDFFVVKYDSLGKALWAKDGGGRNYDEGYCVSTNLYGDAYVSGSFGLFGIDTIVFDNDSIFPPDTVFPYNAFIIKLDSAGNMLCHTSIIGAADDNNSVTVDPLRDNVYFGSDLFGGLKYPFGRDTINGSGGEYPLIAKWTCDDNEQGIPNESIRPDEAKLFPNPNNGQFTIIIASKANQFLGSIEVYNMLGEKVYSQYSIPTSQYTLDISNQPNGVYLYRIIANNGELIGEGKLEIQK